MTRADTPYLPDIIPGTTKTLIDDHRGYIYSQLVVEKYRRSIVHLNRPIPVCKLWWVVSQRIGEVL